MEDGSVAIPLTRWMFAFVDAIDAPAVVGRRWAARIVVNGERKRIGHFDSIDRATAAQRERIEAMNRAAQGGI